MFAIQIQIVGGWFRRCCISLLLPNLEFVGVCIVYVCIEMVMPIHTPKLATKVGIQNIAQLTIHYSGFKKLSTLIECGLGTHSSFTTCLILTF